MPGIVGVRTTDFCHQVIVMADTSSDFSGRVRGDHGYCPECGEAALTFQYADVTVATVLRWWKDGRPELVVVELRVGGHYEERTVSREEFEEAVERAPERNRDGPEWDHYFKLLVESDQHMYDS